MKMQLDQKEIIAAIISSLRNTIDLERNDVDVTFSAKRAGMEAYVVTSPKAGTFTSGTPAAAASDISIPGFSDSTAVADTQTAADAPVEDKPADTAEVPVAEVGDAAPQDDTAAEAPVEAAEVKPSKATLFGKTAAA